MGWILVVLAAGALIWFAARLTYLAFWPGPRSQSQVETVDIMEAAGIVEQQRFGRVRWRRAIVQVPARPLCFEEQINLETIEASNNPNVEVQR